MRRPAATVCVVVLSVGVLQVLAPTAGAAPTCRVRNLDTAAAYVGDGANLQEAIDEAAPGDTLRIAGTCHGNFEIEREVKGSSLTLLGRVTEGAPGPTITADGIGKPLTIRRVDVTVRDLRITGGAARRRGGGIFTTGALLTLAGTTRVVANTAEFGGGVYAPSGSILVQDDVVIARNAAGLGGGIYAQTLLSGAPTVTVSLRDRAVVRANVAELKGGGLRIYAAGLEIRDDVRIARNVAYGRGGGLAVHGPISSLTGDVVVTRNVAARRGGGILVSAGDLILDGAASVTGNEATVNGGGIYVRGALTEVYVCSPYVAISPNDPDDPPPTLPCT
jgi:predicted outer membrane repeat protein